MSVNLPDGWRVATAEEVPTPKSFDRVAVMKGDSKNDGASIQIFRSAIPGDMRGRSALEMTKLLHPNHEARDTTVASMPAAEVDMTVSDMALRQLAFIRGESFYVITLGRRIDDVDTPALFTGVLESIEFSTDPIRVANDGISMVLPDGWRQLTGAELDELRSISTPQNELQRRLAENRERGTSSLVMKHDVAGSQFSAVVNAGRQPMPKKLKFASSIELARVMSAATVATFRGTLEVKPRETTVSGLPAAEFAQRYTLVDPAGRHEMRAHFVFVSRSTYYYMVTYTAPVEDTAYLPVFTTILKSVKFAGK